MSNLIKNEFIKIFKKKSTYIILILTIAFIIFANFMYKYTNRTMYQSGYDDEIVNDYEQNMKSYDPDDPETNQMYIDMKSQLDMLKLMQHYGFNSWQSYVIQTELGSDGDIYTMNHYEYALSKTITKQEYQEAKERYDSFVQKLDADDWRYFVSSKLEEINQQIEIQKKSNSKENQNLYNLQVQKQVLEWRLEKGISYEESFLNTCLRRYANNSDIVYSYEHSDNHSYSEKQEYYSALKVFNTSKYYIENNIANISENDNRGVLLDLLDNYELFILIFAIMIAGSIVSDEFSKGTIKLLLVRPYSRIKILLSKFIVCIIILLLFIAFVATSQFFLGGIIQGFDSTTVPVVIYNHNTNQIETMSILQYIMTTTIAKLPVYILLLTLAFSCSTIFTNTAVSITIPLLGYMSSSFINQLALIYNIKPLLYFVTPNWDFTQYLFGGLSNFEGLTIPFSIIVCLVYFIIMIITSFTVFKKRNIKNV